MKNVKQTAPVLTLQSGSFLEEQYQNYNEMVSSSTDNWAYKCTYELRPRALTGLHRILQLETMMISFLDGSGGMMHDILSAKNCISIGIHIDLEDKACLDRMKCEKGDIVFFDDAKSYNYMTNARVELSVITIDKDRFGEMLPHFEKAVMHKYKDVDGTLGKVTKEIWKTFTSTTPSHEYKEAEDQILEILTEYVKTQEVIPAKLTKGEEAALAIREQVYQHMDGNIKVEDLARQYRVSERNLQISFKALFGFTPKLFIRNLKLNLVRHDLFHEKTEETTVLKVANKWGFSHMGRFSQYYKELFEESPSTTLQRSFDYEKTFTGECVTRQEEI